MNKLFAAALAAAALIAGPASAVTYDAFSSFNGVNGNGGFSYGFTDGATLTAFNFSGADGACVLGSGSTCLSSAANGNLPQASTGGAWPTVAVPTDAVLFHPGNDDALSVYGAFTATTAGGYDYAINLKSVGIDQSWGGVGYTTFTSLAGVVTLGSRGVLPTYLSAASITGSQALAAGQMFGVIVDRNGIYYGDSTAVNFSLSSAAVPEPATWGLMIAGFGLAGAALRRRRAVTTA